MVKLVCERRPSQHDPNCEGICTTRARCILYLDALCGPEMNMARGSGRRLESGLG